MRGLIPALLSLIFASGCSGDGEADDDGTSGGSSGSAGSSGSGPAGSSNGGSSGASAGATATGGGAGAGAGGSSSASVLRGAISLNVLAPSTCSLPAGFIDLPEVAGGHPVTATTKGDVLENGGVTVEGHRVTMACMWAELSNGLFFDGVISIQVGPSRASVNLGAQGLVEGEPSEGGIYVGGAIVPEEYTTQYPGCTHTPIAIDPSTRSIWGEIQCPLFESLESESDCSIGASYYFFENCGEP